ncbi:MAG: methyltransferase domain-containing protein [Micromonosporaceae bacterium]|nr:methyltransferase domain-containing protein [Micromonosporaceae bacterium]
MTRPTLSRSVALFRAFTKEQSDPDFFYGMLARDSVEQLGRYVDLAGKVVLDIGGGPGYFADAFRAAGATYVGIDPDVGELSARGEPAEGMVMASGARLPVRSGSVDVCYSSNVLEHVSRPWEMAAEMVRATRPGGTVFVSYTPWLSPWGGHETSPWHYLGGALARRRYQRRHGKEPKNRYGESLFSVSVASGLRWARRCREATLIEGFPRYHPWWAKPVTRLPGVREIVSWNLALVLRRH